MAPHTPRAVDGIGTIVSTTPVSLRPVAESEPRSPRRIIRLLGMPIDVTTEAEAVDHILAESAAGRGGVVVTPNLDHLRIFDGDREVRDGYDRAHLSLADGMPLLWAARLQGTPLPERVAGSDLSNSLAAAAADAGRSLFLLGGNAGVADAARDVLRQRHPSILISGCHCPPMNFEQDDLEMRRIESLLAAAGPPDIVYVGISFPRSLAVSHRLHERFPGTWFLGLGISLSFISGEVARAPGWMSAAGLEWIHRIGQEPRRLARRYLVEGIPFGARLLRGAARARSARR